MLAHVEWAERCSAWPQFVRAHAAETEAKRSPAEPTAGIWSLGCANPPELKPCHNLAAKLLAVLGFQTTCSAWHNQLLILKWPGNLRSWQLFQVHWSLLLKNKVTMNNWSLFHFSTLKSWEFAALFWLFLVVLNTIIFKIRTVWKPYAFPQSTLIL